jgi:hypothetical protein
MLQHLTAPAGAAARLPGRSSFPASIRSSVICPSRRQQVASSSSSSRSRCSPRPIPPLQSSAADPFTPSAAKLAGVTAASNASSNAAADATQQKAQQGGSDASSSAACPFHQQGPAAADATPAGLTEAAAAAAAVPAGDAHGHHSSSSSNGGAAQAVANLAGPGGCWRALPDGNTSNVRMQPHCSAIMHNTL